MTVVVSSNLVLSDALSGGGVINANNPLIGYQNLVTAVNVSATTEASGSPASNLANPSTNLRWQASEQSPPADEFITLDLSTNEDVDYIAIARHNLHTGQIAASVDVLDESTSPASWVELVSPVLLPNDGPALFQFTPQAITQIRLRLQAGLAAPFVAVLYAGKLLQLQRRIYVGHTPINFGRQTKVVTGKSESGDFLGRIVLSEMVQSSFDLQNLTPSWLSQFSRSIYRSCAIRSVFLCLAAFRLSA